MGKKYTLCEHTIFQTNSNRRPYFSTYSLIFWYHFESDNIFDRRTSVNAIAKFPKVICLPSGLVTLDSGFVKINTAPTVSKYVNNTGKTELLKYALKINNETFPKIMGFLK